MRSILVLVAATGLVVSTGCKSPEEKLAGHMEEMTEIMEDNKDEPQKGVEELREYLHDNLPEMAEASAELLVEIDKLESKSERKDRIEEAMEAVREPMAKMVSVGIPFLAEAAGDEDVEDYVKDMAKAYMKLGRSLEDDAKDFGEDELDPKALTSTANDAAEEYCECRKKSCRKKQGLIVDMTTGIAYNFGSKYRRKAERAWDKMRRCR